jgi:hypothetical protein
VILEPDLPNHPKFIQYRVLVGPVAMEHLVRLWAHCHQNKRGQFWPGVSAHYVEVVCTGQSKKGRVFTALKACQWIHERVDGIEVHDWEKHNASLVARWKRDKKPAYPTDNSNTQPPTEPPAQPLSSSCTAPEQTPAQEGHDMTGHDMTGRDVKGPDGSTINRGSRFTPTLAEAVEWFQRNGSGYTSDQVEAAFNSFEATKHPDGWWKLGQGMVTDWRAALSTRLALFDKKNPAPRVGSESSGDVPPPPGAAAVDFNAMRS